jgi:hypothetical protein
VDRNSLAGGEHGSDESEQSAYRLHKESIIEKVGPMTNHDEMGKLDEWGGSLTSSKTMDSNLQKRLTEQRQHA